MKGSISPAVINGLRRISPITVETIKEFSQVMKSQTFKECSQRSAFNMSSQPCIAGSFLRPDPVLKISYFITHFLNGPSIWIGHSRDSQTGVSPIEKLRLWALNSPTGSSDWPSRKRDNYLPEQ